LTEESPLISIVEDDQHVRASIGRLLRSVGFTAKAFASAVDFLDFSRFRESACLIADINMPVMTGVELHHRLIEIGRQIPTILITAYPDDRVRNRALADGILCYLKKPFDDSDLLRCVRMALDASKPPDENS
jgi:FixJ family two-component response regulator